MNEVLKNPYVVSGIVFILALITIAFNIGGNSNTTVILQPDTTSVIADTNSQVNNILPEPQIAEESDEIIPLDFDDTDIGSVIQPVYSTKTSAGNTITINNFGEMASISSPLVLTGAVPTNWIFEGIFSINIYTLEGELVKEWYGTANIFNDDSSIKEGPVEFTSSIEFDIPDSADMGKIRFKNDNPSGEPENDDLVEVQVVFE